LPARAYCPFNKPQYPSPSLRRISRNEMHWFHSRVRLGSCIARNIHQQLWICGAEGRDRARKKKSPIVAPRTAEGLGSLRVVCPLGLPIHATGVCSKPGTGGWGAASLPRRGLAAPFLLGFTGMCGSFGRTGRRGCNSSFIKVRAWKGWKAESATRGFLPTPNSCPKLFAVLRVVHMRSQSRQSDC